MSLTLFRPKVIRLVRDSGDVLVDPDDYDFALQEAAKRYSRAKAKTWVVDLAGDGTFDYELPDTWDDEFSQPKSVEYPAGRREPSLVDPLDWKLYRTANGTVLRFAADTPKVGETIRFTYSGLHTIEELTTTVPASDQDIVIYLAAAHCCEQLASHYTNAGDSTIQADSVDHKSKATEYAARAKRFHGLANEMLPIQQQGEIRAASGQTSWGDRVDLLSHPQR